MKLIKRFSLVCILVLLMAALSSCGGVDARFSVGSRVSFGNYQQSADNAEYTPIEWLVLARDGSKALLLSRYGLDVQPYNTELSPVTWETCTLRSWLNSIFLNMAFTEKEQKAILMTDVDNSKSQGYSQWSIDGGNNTQDRIFLLSYAEANRYFGVTYDDSKNTQSRVEPTAYAIKQGARIYSVNKTAEGKAAGWWWLRSPGYYQFSAADVDPDGSLNDSFVNDTIIAVRPALWVNLESGIF